MSEPGLIPVGEMTDDLLFEELAMLEKRAGAIRTELVARSKKRGLIEGRGYYVCNQQTKTPEYPKRYLFADAVIENVDNEQQLRDVFKRTVDKIDSRSWPGFFKDIDGERGFGGRILATMDQLARTLGEVDEGQTTHYGKAERKVRTSPPSEKHHVVAPGDEPLLDPDDPRNKKTEPETVSGPDTEEANNQGDDQNVSD